MVEATLTIRVDAHGSLHLDGCIDQPLLAHGLLGLAQAALASRMAQAAQRVVVPAPGSVPVIPFKKGG